MRALRWHARGDVRLEEVPEPATPQPGWVRLRVEACGICGTDLEEWLAGPVAVRGAPLTLGHEIAGVVVDAGEGVALAAGQRVAVEGNVVCGHCPWCLRGQWNLCEHAAQLGLQLDGGLADQVLAPAAVCAPVADHVPPAHAALAEPVAVAVRAVRLGGVAEGAAVAVIGGGTIGLLLAQVARLAGAAHVLVVEPQASRRELALRLGASEVAEPGEQPAAYDVVFESAGNPAAAAAAVAMTRRGGTAVLLGVFDAPVELDMRDLLFGEKTVRTSLSHVFAPDFTEAVALINAGRLELAPLVTDEIALDDVVAKGLEALRDDPAAHLKVVVVP